MHTAASSKRDTIQRLLQADFDTLIQEATRLADAGVPVEPLTRLIHQRADQAVAFQAGSGFSSFMSQTYSS